METGHSPLENHPQYAQAIGMISVEMGVLEMNLGKLLGAILGIDPNISQIIYMTPRSYFGRLVILQNVINAVMAPESAGTKHLLRFVKRAKARIDYRHDMAHSMWGVLKEDHSVVTKRDIPVIEGTPSTPVSLSELTDEVKKIRQLTDEVIAETREVIEQRAALAASLQKEQKEGLPARKIKGDGGGHNTGHQ